MPKFLECAGGGQLSNSSGPVLQDGEPVYAHTVTEYLKGGVCEMVLGEIKFKAHSDGGVEKGSKLRGMVIEVV